MPYTRHWFIEGQYLGSSEGKVRRIHETAAPPIGHAWFCPHCCRLWATAPVEGQRSMVWIATCRDHEPTLLDTPGSIWLSWEKEFLTEFPPKVRAHELKAHLRWAASLASPGVASAAQKLYDVLP